ncbi:MAG: HAMP domain-containing histidine kinase [Xanthobacteraceae bacterium]|nr:MAG: HAMP domain-containing histidine kinase [Xanthobacteraceae bacterium]
MTAFGKLIRTTAFRLTLVYLLLFALFAASLLGYFAWNTRRLITEQITATVNTEMGELIDHYQQGGLRRLTVEVENRALRPGSNLYLVSNPQGQGIAGNVASLGPGVMSRVGWSETFYQRLDDPGERNGDEHHAIVRVYELTNGFRVLVGRDVEERRRLFGVITAAARWSILVVIVLGVGGGIFVGRRVLRRIDAMTASTQRIMAGNLGERLPVGRSGDELDRLAGNLNVMLERIEALMGGLKEVSDNIAHDLKTPLTRLRNRCEAALASGSEAGHRAALEQTIEESDGLIRTFDALLMIARAESGQARDGMTKFDGAEVARGIHELYEPLAEDKGLALRVDAPVAMPLYGSRELIGQALANLVENAIKYGVPAPGSSQSEIVVAALADGERVFLSVADHGPGISEQDRRRVVERFVRLEASRTEPGSGLGLSLASAVATLHGGELRLEDNHPGLRAVLALPGRGPEPTLDDAERGNPRSGEHAGRAT